MKIAQLLSELNSRAEQFKTYSECMEWLVTRAKELSGGTQDRMLLDLLSGIQHHVSFNCEFGDKEHKRDDSCWYCNMSICGNHCAKRILIGDTFFSVCPKDIDKINMLELNRVAEDITRENEVLEA